MCASLCAGICLYSVCMYMFVHLSTHWNVAPVAGSVVKYSRREFARSLTTTWLTPFSAWVSAIELVSVEHQINNAEIHHTQNRCCACTGAWFIRASVVRGEHAMPGVRALRIRVSSTPGMVLEISVRAEGIDCGGSTQISSNRSVFKQRNMLVGLLCFILQYIPLLEP